MTYFRFFPTVAYGGQQITNVMERAGVLRRAADAPLEVRDGLRPDFVAQAYYSDPGRAWIVMLSAGVIDPYTDWCMSDSELQDAVARRWGSMEEALQRVRFYRLNWIAVGDPALTAAGFAALDDATKKYYEPVLGAGSRVIGYTRRTEDWTAATNEIVRWTITTPTANLIADERVSVYDGANNAIGGGQVACSNATSVTIQHVHGNTQPVGNATMIAVSSRATATMTASVRLAFGINADEQEFYSPVSAWDEARDANELRRNVNLLEARYADEAERELKNLLR